MVEVSELERIAGRTHLDSETIHFLEDNLWERDFNATFEGVPDDMTELERIAGRRNLDTETIQFLEDNLWEYEFNAEFAGEPSPNDVSEEAFWFYEYEAALLEDDELGVYDLDPNNYSEELLWQDLVEPYAGFAEHEADGTIAEPLPPTLTP
jgi:hypothetical protein